MAKRSKSAAEAVELTPAALTAPQLPDITPPQRPELVQPQPPESPQLGAQQPVRQWRANPFPVKTVNLGGFKVQLQESRPERAPSGPENDHSQPQKKGRWEMQIKFGSGALEDKPSTDVIEYITSHKLDVTTREGEPKQVQLFKWNDEDRAWGMEIDYNNAGASREKAHAVFNETVKLVAAERGVGQSR
jgi:hypothetical protein